jgi:energy-coupling factor transporter ATP-binding protein EcfA2
MNHLLTCEAFNFPIQGKTYSSDGFHIDKGEIVHLFSTSEFVAQNFLLLVAGLLKARVLTNPGTSENLERQKVEISNEELSFLKLDNTELYSLLSTERAKNIGFIYENPDIAIFGRTVKDDFFQSFAIINKEPNSVSLIEYGLYEKIDRQTNVLSGGEKHRLICANAFERKPKLIIGDFSSSNLDKSFLESFLKWLLKYVKDVNGSVLLHGLSHEELDLFTQDIVYLYGESNGNILKKEPPNDLFPRRQEAREIIKSKLALRNIGNVLHEFTDVYIKEYNTKPISFSLRENEILIIEGNNGCGKTTLGKIITKKIKKFNGSIQPPIKSRAGISLQFPERSFIHWKIWKELPDEQLLELCDISKDKWNSHPRILSRSHQKLLSIACALHYSTGITILDEPTTGVDFHHKIRFIEILNHFSDRAIIIFNHDPILTNIVKTIKFI